MREILLVKPCSDSEDYILVRKDILDILTTIDPKVITEHNDGKCKPGCVQRGIEIGIQRTLKFIRAYEAAQKVK